MKKVSLKKLLFLTLLGLVLVGCDQMPFGSGGGRYPASSMPPSTACYALESGVTLTVDPVYLSDAGCQTQLGGKTYARIRQELKIVESKIREGQSYSPSCQSGVSKLRKVGDLPGNEEIYWEDESYEGNNLTDFIFLFKRQEEGHYYFDVYIDETVEIPEFVENCQETGGLIPVMEGFALPPQVFGLQENPAGDDIPGEFSADCTIFPCLMHAGRTDYFEEKRALGELKPYYVQVADDGSFPTGVGSGIGLIGTLTATGTDGEKTYNVYYHADTMYLRELDGSGNETGQIYVYSPTDGPPPKPAGRHPTLQLKALKFVSTATWTWATPECKPVIYLYPEEETRLSLELDPAGYLTETEPLYEDGWRNVVAHPDGSLVYQGETFDSLHYEAMIDKFRTPQEGWVVKREDLPEFFEGILPRLGLNDQEAGDFEDYWLGRLTASPYFFAGLLSAEEIERIEPVDFSTEPDTFIRVRFYFKDLGEPFVVNPPVLSSPPARTGFTAVEWGGLYQGE